MYITQSLIIYTLFTKALLIFFLFHRSKMYTTEPNLTTTSFPDVNSTSDDYTPYGERLETYLVPVLFAIIFIVGVLGNGTLVIVYVRHRGMRNAPNT